MICAYSDNCKQRLRLATALLQGAWIARVPHSCR